MMNYEAYGLPNIKQDTLPFKPLPVHYGLTEITWERDRPESWMRIPFIVAHKNGWYISVTAHGDYLVMPIFRNGKQVFYSARRLRGEGSKYIYPKGVDKRVWISHNMERGIDIRRVFLVEGAADAAYLTFLFSKWAGAIGLLGSYLSPEVFTLTEGMIIYTMFDGDVKGREATMGVQKKMPWSIPIFLPRDADPTDLTKRELHSIMKQQGIKI